MKDTIYGAVYRLFKEGESDTVINVGGIDLSLYDTTCESPYYIWDMGIVANGKRYQVGDLGFEGKAPNTYADFLTGDYDVIDALAEAIYNDNVNG